jgi:hypothetical protein
MPADTRAERTTMAKRVRITIEADSQFVRLLVANVELSALREKEQLQPIDALALVTCAEMRGGLEHEVDALIPPEWRDQLAVIHDERRVVELADRP